MSDFEPAFKFLMLNEGWDADNPKDKGGRTRGGITKGFLDSIGIKKHIEDLTFNDVYNIYEEYKWNPCKYFLIKNQQIASKIFDMNINMGPKEAHLLLQRALNDMCKNPILEDGIIGPETIERTNIVSQDDLINNLKKKCKDFYEKIVVNDPSQKVFLNDWLNRAAS